MKTLKQLSQRSLSVLLAFLMIVYTLPLTSIIAITASAENEKNSQTIDDRGMQISNDVFEIKELRGESVKHFSLEDGSCIAVQYTSPVHYLDSEGVWQDINNTLSSNGNEYSTSNARVKFAKKTNGSENLFTLHEGNRKITFSLNGAIKKTTGSVTNTQTVFDSQATELQKMMTLDKLSSKILYADILQKTDLEYVVESNDIKENIIVKDICESYSYSFTIKLNNLKAKKNSDGSIYIYDPETDENVYVIPKGYMYDSVGKYSDEVSYSLTDCGNNKYIMTVTADSEWINDDARVFPIVIDPTVSEISGSSNTIDTYVDESVPGSYFNTRAYVAVGSYSSDGHDFVGYWNGPIPEIPESAYINEVTLNYYCQNYRLNDSSDSLLYIEAYPVTSSWSGTITWNQYVNQTIGKLDSVCIDYKKVDMPKGGTGYINWDITTIAKKWYDGSMTKYGIALKQNGTAYNSALLSSSDSSTNKPYVCVSYRDTKGIESYLSYSSQNAGLAGTGYVNNATGNLTFVRSLLSTTDSLMHYAPSIVYNSALSSKEYKYPNAQTSYWGAYMPLGFKMSIQETIIKKKYTSPDGSEVYYYIWADADGTEHAFMPTNVSGQYADEDGLQLRLTVTGDVCTISDDSKTVKTFEKLSSNAGSDVYGGWYLTTVTDKNGHSLNFTFDSGKRPVTVSVTPKGSSKIDFFTIKYNSEYVPDYIWNQSSGEVIIFRYSPTTSGTISLANTKYLRGIIYAHCDPAVNNLEFDVVNINGTSTTHIKIDGIAHYSYNSDGYLTKAEDGLSGYEIRYTYSGCKVVSVMEYANKTSAGQKIGYKYFNGYTECQSSGSDDIYGTGDDIVTRYTFDRLGRAISVYSTDYGKTQIYGASYGEYETDNLIKNNIKTSAAVGGSVSNYLLNGGFENVDNLNPLYWTKTSSNIGITTSSGIGQGIFNLCFNAKSGRTDSIYQYTRLPLGRYTLSMNILTNECKNVDVYVIAQSLDDPSHVYTEKVSVNNAPMSDEQEFFSMNFNAFSYNSTGGEAFKIQIKTVGGNNVSYDAQVLIDNVMLEEGIGSNDYTMVNVGNFEQFTINYAGTYADKGFWTSDTEDITYVKTGAPFGYAGKVNSSITDQKYLYQTIYQASSVDIDMFDSGYTRVDKSKRFIVSGFAKASTPVPSSESVFSLRVDVSYYNGKNQADTVVPYEISFGKDCTDWQFVCGSFETVDERLIHSIKIYCEFSYVPSGYALFDNIAVIESMKVLSNMSITVRRMRYWEINVLRMKSSTVL